jgi:hypothetical protein
MSEIWKDIEGYEGLYQVSSYGRVKSLPKQHRYGSKSEKILKPKTTKKNNYSRCSLSKDGIIQDYRVHRLVAIHFIPNPENKPEVNHLNGIKDDNRIQNLQWATPKENSQHAWDTGLSSITDKWIEAMKLITNRKHTEESKQKISKANKGKKVSAETRLKLSIIGKTRKHSDESIEKMKLAKRNRNEKTGLFEKNTIGNLVGMDNKNNNIQHR